MLLKRFLVGRSFHFISLSLFGVKCSSINHLHRFLSILFAFVHTFSTLPPHIRYSIASSYSSHSDMSQCILYCAMFAYRAHNCVKVLVYRISNGMQRFFLNNKHQSSDLLHWALLFQQINHGFGENVQLRIHFWKHIRLIFQDILWLLSHESH